MINKYALGTVLSTTLLGLTKSKLGSGSSKLKSGNKINFKSEILIIYLGGVDRYYDLQQNLIVLDEIKNLRHKYQLIITGFEFYEYDAPYRILKINVEKNYFSDMSQENINERTFRDEFSRTIDKFEKHLMAILLWNELYPDDIEIDNSIGRISRHPYIKDQSGEWVPYTISTPDSKLRKR